jgi:PAT family beta-lactamase induction signal transducer AmpG
MVSGFIQKAAGYQTFFVIVLVAAVPSILATLFAPYPHPDGTMREVKKPEAEPKPIGAV